MHDRDGSPRLIQTPSGPQDLFAQTAGYAASRAFERAWRPGHSGGAGIIRSMSTSRSRRFPVTVTHLPVTRCQICDRTLAYRAGNISEVLTEHYRRTHPEALGIPAQ